MYLIACYYPRENWGQCMCTEMEIIVKCIYRMVVGKIGYDWRLVQIYSTTWY